MILGVKGLMLSGREFQDLAAEYYYLNDYLISSCQRLWKAFGTSQRILNKMQSLCVFQVDQVIIKMTKYTMKYVIKTTTWLEFV